jgi:hypothetical protein
MSLQTFSGSSASRDYPALYRKLTAKGAEDSEDLPGPTLLSKPDASLIIFPIPKIVRNIPVGEAFEKLSCQ